MCLLSEQKGMAPLISVGKEPTLVNKTGLWKFLAPVRKEKISPCRAACPLENGIPPWMEKVKAGDFAGAWRIMEKYNPFPAITGYVCYRFCQEECNRGLFDEAIAIGDVEKAIGLWRLENYGSKEAPSSSAGETRDKKVAVVGSGPGGLSCAYYLNKLGVEITVLEKQPLPGGLLATGIPEYRLPREILQRELEILKREGINFRCSLQVGKDLELKELARDFDAVILAVGAQASRKLKVPGEELPGVTTALEFLRSINLKELREVEFPVAVIGGGNAALDAACEARLKGAREVYLLYRRGQEEMPAHPSEIKAAEQVGVKFVFNAVLDEIWGREKVEKIRLLRTAPSHRGEKIKVLGGSGFEMECKTVIIAAGQESSLKELVPSFLEKELLGAGKGGVLSIKGLEGQKGSIFALGDAVTGPTSVASAIFSGRQAAIALAGSWGFSAGEGEGLAVAPPLEDKREVISFESINTHFYRQKFRLSLPEEEAGRCFSCGFCNRCGVCWAFCPDLAVESLSGEFNFSLDYCKGCGICANECPARVLNMEEV